jgi:ABC-type uncharacterized transport system substrate-binding protein
MTRSRVASGCSAAWAHPHVWVTVTSELVYAPDGTLAVFDTCSSQSLENRMP